MDKNYVNQFASEITKLLPGQSIDCVILGYDQHELLVLLSRWKNSDTWGLPGGFIYKDEDMNQAAVRVLNDRTGLDFPFLTQFHTFGALNRRDPQELIDALKRMGITDKSVIEWFKHRFVSTGYLALVDIKECHPRPDVLSDVCEWKPINELPKLIFDHENIIKKAVDQIRIQINYLPVGLSLLPEKFTFKDLQKLYEGVTGTKLDRANFQKKILKLGITIRLEKQMNGGAHKAPFLYKFDREKYEELMKNGISFMS